ncbi:hopanoid biosynthesis protein HpnM [alpha proteobacterium AAP81b]|nr:hopanoid biosynthesis protein HpnM [alpha proteobacterium AAP81b]
MTMRIAPALIAALLAAFPVSAALLAAGPALAAEASPTQRLSTYNDGVVAIMKAGLPLPARVARFESLVKAHYDMAGIAALVVGTKWAAAAPEDKAAAIAALTRHSAVSLAKNFVSFGGERFETDPAAVARGTSSLVKVTIASKTSRAVLQYRLRQVAGEWRIIDVVSEGVSQLALQRAELAGTIAGEGVAGLSRKLAEKDRI